MPTSSSPVNPRRGEIWLVDFNPTKGAEINKIRPAVVVSSDSVGRLRIKLVAPVTGWNDGFASNLWHVRVDPNRQNSLDKMSAVDALQVRCVDVLRFQRRIGRLSTDIMDQIAAAIAMVVEYR